MYNNNNGSNANAQQQNNAPRPSLGGRPGFKPASKFVPPFKRKPNDEQCAPSQNANPASAHVMQPSQEANVKVEGAIKE